jgi:hypothetical protein
MPPTTFTQRGALMVDPRSGPSRVSPLELGWGQVSHVRLLCRAWLSRDKPGPSISTRAQVSSVPSHDLTLWRGACSGQHHGFGPCPVRASACTHPRANSAGWVTKPM